MTTDFDLFPMVHDHGPRVWTGRSAVPTAAYDDPLPLGPHSHLAVDATVILPTYNERENIERLLQELDTHMAGLPFRCEILVVDDNSQDGTAEIARSVYTQVRTRVLVRSHERGLASALLRGLQAARGRACVVMDADRSHPADMVPQLIQTVLSGRAEMVVASRYLGHGGVQGWPWYRHLISWGATVLARPLSTVKDPMSGFFAVDRRILQGKDLNPIGYKLGLEILVRCHPSPLLEVPFVFSDRVAGQSKMTGAQVINYLRHVGRLYGWKVLHAFGGPSPPSRSASST